MNIALKVEHHIGRYPAL